MGEIDPLKTQRDVIPTVSAAELAEAGFTYAEEIGRGGFGVVYRCTQAALDRTVAVKVLTASPDKGNQERFVREQRAMGRLTGHPNIVGMLQVGVTTSGLPYLVMPYYPQDSLDARIRRHGPLPAEEVVRLGVKLAGALATAHRLGILHRDIKPGNVLITDYGEPALSDFGIAHIPDGFHTATGTVTGSPAFIAPEVLAGEAPTSAADVYGFGATLFAALTGHVVFERHTSQGVVAQFLRFTTQPTPDLREHGIDEDLSTVIELAMDRAPQRRPSAAAMGEQLQQVQAGRGWPIDVMAVGADQQAATPVPLLPLSAGRSSARQTPGAAGGTGSLPLELTSFVGRRTELTEAKSLLANSRLVTLTGIGGVGKTRMALQLATGAQRGFADGVWLVQLAELHDGALLPGVIAAALGLRPHRKPMLEALIDYLASRELLLVLDNCEQIVDAAAKVVETLLRACPTLRVLATSREALGIGGETVLRVRPLTVPDPDRQPPLRGAARYDAIRLFVERATAAVPGFALTEDNVAAVAEICRRLDGLPLAIELAVARLRALAPEQILRRLTDRYALLTGGSRSAPSRQQTLRWCIDWSYSLCTQAEQQVWAQLSVFAGSFELDAAEQVCSGDLGSQDLLDVLTALVDKSILIRQESDSAVRFRLLETIRDYGRDKLEQADTSMELRRRHRDWYRQLAENADADWISPRQFDWMARLGREQPNLREALDFCLTDTEAEPDDAALSFTAALQPFWYGRGQLGEARYWLDRALADAPANATPVHAKALWRASMVAQAQDDHRAVSALVMQAEALAEQTAQPIVHAFVGLTQAMHAVRPVDLPRRRAYLEAAVESFAAQGEVSGQIYALLGLGLAHALWEENAAALSYNEQALAIAESHGDSVLRAYALWAAAVAEWRQGDYDRALRLLRQEIQLIKPQKDPFDVAIALETLAWIVGAQGNALRAAVLLGAAKALSQAMGGSSVFFPEMAVVHEACERAARHTLGQRPFETAYREGAALDLDAATDYALGAQSTTTAPGPGPSTELTRREQEVAALVANGLTNRAIAARLHISQRTAEAHVEHIRTKLGFTSRAQIAAWVGEQNRPAHR
ncbi:protein kinase [Nocardia sp. NEAU-G5]|uniref:Protein kinase n=1 Tax=Nocardia albiluteola TaxID=2842303 RepID=A0ABS6B5U4_9NOCA|nr:protein kinase [Nocardia albiluteola]MBU3065703.1 protein kinase [Nocardia albiluteola]